MATRNKYLTTKAFNIYLGASILTALSSMLGNIVDSIIVSNQIDPNAMSAVSLSRPLIQLYYTIHLLVGLGGSLLVAFALGKNDREGANRTLSVVVGATAIFGLLLTVIGVAAPQLVVDIFCSEGDGVYTYAMQYFSPLLWGCLFYMGSYFFGTYATLDGAPRLVSVAMIVDNVCNLSFDLLLINVFGMGTAGSAIASNIGHAVGIAIMATHFMRGKSAIRIVRVGLSDAARLISRIARSGAPFAVASICLTIYMYAANSLILNRYGDNGIYIFSVMLSLLTFYNFFLSGACNTLQSLGALLVGMGDVVGLRLSVKAAFRFLTISMVVCCGVLWIMPGVVCRLFGCPEALLPECCYACRIYAAAFVFFCLIYLLMVNYKLLKHEALSNFISFALSLSVIAVIWVIVSYVDNPDAIWWSNLIAYLIVFGVTLVWSQLKRRQGESFLTLLPTREAYPTLDFSTAYTADGLANALSQISQFLEQQGVGESGQYAIRLSAEELLKNVIAYSHTSAPRAAFIDIRLQVSPADDGAHVALSIRDDGTPFDPTSAQNRGEGYGLKLATAFGQKLSYKYMFGQNISLVEYN